ncbi:MAG TPA: HesA/MoeB/ThiF family protein [Ignavibacteria bacterium]|nr:thiamine biosynthesis protein ThiF [Bacteroidota bacterium]HRI84353.1 HesA/MoeB/ThiF family protein [Ignavibacteria bacterium]HRJ98852.1 HesA/MoeB/ThiF family protein [Ignavibacteria bacterium]
MTSLVNRYERQIRLKEIGTDGQMKLKKASVLVIGAGGIGCPLLSYLCASGVGKIGIADYDKVDISNLHRQVLYNESQTGMYKTEAAMENLIRLNSETEFRIFNTSVGKTNGRNIIGDFDIIADATDNLRSRYIINDLCVEMKKPLIWGAVNKFELQVSVFNCSGGTDLRKVFPEINPEANLKSCEEQGVTGPVPGLAAMIMSAEAIKIITGCGAVLCNEMLIINTLTNEFRKIAF